MSEHILDKIFIKAFLETMKEKKMAESLEGKTYDHKEIAEYANRLKQIKKTGDSKQAVQCLQIIQNMVTHALVKLTRKDKLLTEKYFKEIF